MAVLTKTFPTRLIIFSARAGCFAISEEEIFYAQSRGIARADAERMIALGFFEPTIARFPSESLRSEVRAALANKLRTEEVV